HSGPTDVGGGVRRSGGNSFSELNKTARDRKQLVSLATAQWLIVRDGGDMRNMKWLGCLWATALAGCSIYPIPDDVTSINTEDIIRYARCELRSAIIDHIVESGLIAPSATEGDVIKFVKATVDKVKRLEELNLKRPPNNQIDIDKRLSKTEQDIRRLADV